jgi:hypothetical protein
MLFAREQEISDRLAAARFVFSAAHHCGVVASHCYRRWREIMHLQAVTLNFKRRGKLGSGFINPLSELPYC